MKSQNLSTKIRSISARTSLTMAPESELDNMASREHMCIHGTSRAGWPSRTIYSQKNYISIKRYVDDPVEWSIHKSYMHILNGVKFNFCNTAYKKSFQIYKIYYIHKNLYGRITQFLSYYISNSVNFSWLQKQKLKFSPLLVYITCKEAGNIMSGLATVTNTYCNSLVQMKY